MHRASRRTSAANATSVEHNAREPLIYKYVYVTYEERLEARVSQHFTICTQVGDDGALHAMHAVEWQSMRERCIAYELQNTSAGFYLRASNTHAHTQIQIQQQLQQQQCMHAYISHLIKYVQQHVVDKYV